MAVEPKRGCGYRKVGGLYLVGNRMGSPCCRLPIPLTVCPCCSAGIKQARGWTWVKPALLLGQDWRGASAACRQCPAAHPAMLGERAGLLWVGEAFYKTPLKFDMEARGMGISRRIHAVPQGFKLGSTWVLLAHPKACPVQVTKPGELIPSDDGTPGVFRIFLPQRIEKILTESMATKDELAALDKRGITPVVVPDGDKDHQ